MKNEYWRDKNFSFYCNERCEAFPCHPVDDTDDFNCLFCYCPLYSLGEKCGGYFTYIGDGIKDCSNCTLPHEKDNYGIITGKLMA